MAKNKKMATFMHNFKFMATTKDVGDYNNDSSFIKFFVNASQVTKMLKYIYFSRHSHKH